MKLEILNKKEYTDFEKNYPNMPFLQNYKQKDLSNLNNWESIFLGVKENNKVVAATRLMKKPTRLKKDYYYSPRGPLLDYDNKELLTFFTNEVKNYIKDNNGYVYVIEPNIIHKQRDIDGNVVEGGLDNSNVINTLKDIGYKHNGFDTEFNYNLQVRWNFVLNLKDKTKDQVFKNFRQNHRNILNRTNKFNIEIEEITKDKLKDYKKITEDTSIRRDFPDKSLKYYETAHDIYSENNEVKYLIAYLNTKDYKNQLQTDLKNEEAKYERLKDKTTGRAKEQLITINSLKKRLKEAKELNKQGDRLPLSAAMFLLVGNEVTYLFSGSYDEYMHFYAQYAIQWYMIQYAIKNNFEKFNFYGISGNFDRSHKDYGIYDFKKGFGGVVEEYIGSFELVISPIHYYFKKLLDKIRK